MLTVLLIVLYSRKFLPPEDDVDDVKDNWEDETESSSQPPPAKSKANAFALLGGDDSDTTEGKLIMGIRRRLITFNEGMRWQLITFNEGMRWRLIAFNEGMRCRLIAFNDGMR